LSQTKILAIPEEPTAALPKKKKLTKKDKKEFVNTNHQKDMNVYDRLTLAEMYDKRYKDYCLNVLGMSKEEFE